MFLPQKVTGVKKNNHLKFDGLVMGGAGQTVLYADAVLSSVEIKDKKLRLSIELSLDGFSFSVKNITDDIFLLCGHTYIKYGSTYTRMLSALIETIETTPQLSTQHFHEAEIIYSDAIYTLLPMDLYDRSHMTDYLSFSVGRDLTQDRTITADDIPTYDCVCVYQTQEKIKEYISTRAENVYSYHSMSLFLNNVCLISSDTEVQLHVNMYPTHMCVAAFIEGKLLMANTYPIKDNTSFAYYILSLCNKLDINEKTTPIIWYGDPESYVKYQDSISRYFHASMYAQRQIGVKFSPALDYVATYECYNILNH